MKYVVSLGYKDDYEFDDMQTAVNFAELAYTNKVDRKGYDYATVNIKDDDWKEEDNG